MKINIGMIIHRYYIMLAILMLVSGGFSLYAQDRAARGGIGPDAKLSIILGRPTDRSITLSVLSAAEIEALVEYGTEPGTYTGKTESRNAKANVPFEFEIDSLQPDTGYFYRLLTRSPGKGDFQPASEGGFHTQRQPGSTFTFALQGDSHPEREGKMLSPELYTQTMHSVAKDSPDFYITMGDDFSIERLIERATLSQDSVDQVYALQRTFLGVIGGSSPLFLVNGNHEQAARCNLDGTPNSPGALAGRTRTTYYPLPAPGAFYSGDMEEVPSVGLLRDYYAWTWGDALFVVIDFYWHSAVVVDNKAGSRDKEGKGGGNKEKGGGKKDKADKGGDGAKRDLWEVTLGDVQYQWLTKTLMESKARWKFVFCHHVLGTGRGGIEEAGLYEWGGKDRNGQSLFASKRPGWELPIHDLLVKTGVTIFFQGHDHIYAHQELGGVVYQSCPNPADNTYQAFNRDAYQSGDVLPNSGHLRVTVAPDNVRVDYIRSYLPKDATKEHPDGETTFTYEIPFKPKQ